VTTSLPKLTAYESSAFDLVAEPSPVLLDVRPERVDERRDHRLDAVDLSLGQSEQRVKVHRRGLVRHAVDRGRADDVRRQTTDVRADRTDAQSGRRLAGPATVVEVDDAVETPATAEGQVQDVAHERTHHCRRCHLNNMHIGYMQHGKLYISGVDLS